MTTLARKLRLVDYFALAFGVMVGTAWLVVMDDILQRGGPLGAILGFTAGALMLLPIGYVYGQLVRAIPDAAAEAAYVALFFPPSCQLRHWLDGVSELFSHLSIRGTGRRAESPDICFHL